MAVVDTKEFFSNSDLLDRLVLRQLSHIKGNWELAWDYGKGAYESEENSYATLLNKLIEELGGINPPASYHYHEDCLVECLLKNSNWNLKKVGGLWVCGDYATVLEQGSFDDTDQKKLMLATLGRIKAAIDRNQLHFDDMEWSHQTMLADVLAVILYHRT